MAGSGVRLFQSGEVLTAAQVNGYLMDQTVSRFANAAARDAAFGGVGEPVLTEGRVCYLDDVNLIQFYDGAAWQDSQQFTVADGTITTAKLADNSVTSDKIAPGTVIAADIAAGSITNAEVNASAGIALSKLATGTQGTVVIHNSSGVPTATALSGDIAVTNAGVTSISSGVIVNADISASAGIALSKLATSTAGNIIVYNASGVPTAVAESGDITISDTGVTAIGTGKVTSSMILDGTIVDGDISSSASIALSKLATGALPTAITIASANITDGTIVNADISTTASVAYSKLNLSGSIVNADISSSAAIADSKLATISTAGKVSNSATTAVSTNTASAIVARDASGNFAAGKATLSTADITTVIETASVSSASATGTINIDFSTNPTVYYTGAASADWTLNVRGTSGATLDSTLATGQIASVTFLATIGVTQRRPTTFQIDGVSISPKWQGGVAPTTGNANSIDAYSLSIIKTGSSTFTMLASQTRFA